MAVNRPRLHWGVWLSIALAWVLLGGNSNNVPVGSTGFWIALTGIVAGAAIGVAARGTQNSMIVYALAALTAGVIRSASYIDNGSGGPAAVWLIVALTNVVLITHWSGRNGR